MKRNGVVFEQQNLDAETLSDAKTLSDAIKQMIALWSKAWKDAIPYSSAELARNFGSLHILSPQFLLCFVVVFGVLCAFMTVFACLASFPVCYSCSVLPSFIDGILAFPGTNNRKRGL